VVYVAGVPRLASPPGDYGKERIDQFVGDDQLAGTARAFAERVDLAQEASVSRVEDRVKAGQQARSVGGTPAPRAEAIGARAVSTSSAGTTTAAVVTSAWPGASAAPAEKFASSQPVSIAADRTPGWVTRQRCSGVLVLTPSARNPRRGAPCDPGPARGQRRTR
jgi:hypothetical protein